MLKPKDRFRPSTDPVLRARQILPLVTPSTQRVLGPLADIMEGRSVIRLRQMYKVLSKKGAMAVFCGGDLYCRKGWRGNEFAVRRLSRRTNRGLVDRRMADAWQQIGMAVAAKRRRRQPVG